MTAPIIETTRLCKRFGPQKALDDVTLSVLPGAIGLLGPNGAGKSTFMKCLLQLQPITSGSARLLGREVGREGREIRKRVGYTPEQDCHIPGMVGCEYVTYCAQLCGLGHARMRGFVTVQSAEEFQKWNEEAIAEQAGAAADPFR